MDIVCTPFGRDRAGHAVLRYTLTEGALSASILTLGGVLQSLTVPDRNGKPVDVVLGFDSAEDYEQQTCYIGALIGRCANRIAEGRFVLNGQPYQLACNENGTTHLHGGENGFDKRQWITSIHSEGLSLQYHSPAGEEGYPGALHAAVTYRLTADSLIIDYHAEADAPTPCNLTNHSYFNLDGHGAGTVGGQRIRLNAARYTPIDAASIPTGEIAATQGTPMDLTRETPLGAHWDDDFDQLRLAGGYDHNFVVDGAFGTLRPAARVRSERTGIVMNVETTMPGIQLYTGNFLRADMPAGKGGAKYAPRHGFCLETQYYPSALTLPQFPQPVLRPGETYRHQTVFRFSAE